MRNGIIIASCIGFALACGGVPVNDESTATTSAPILGGTPVPAGARPNVGVIRSFEQWNVNMVPTSFSVCTGTHVGPHAILTAAHCLDGKMYDVSFDDDPNLLAPYGTGTWHSIAYTLAHPSYDPNAADVVAAHAHDLGMLFLSTPTQPYRQIEPVPPAPETGASVTIVGYGRDVKGSDAFSVGIDGKATLGVGVKRAVTTTIVSVGATEFVAGSDGHGSCHGDSGGLVESNGHFIGTVSYGTDANCNGAGHYMNLSEPANMNFINAYAF